MIFGLDQIADVYTPASSNGDYTDLAKEALPCRLAYIQQGGTTIADDREPVGHRRRLLWEENYTMPSNAQIEVDGDRYNVIAGTIGALRGVDGRVAYRRCEVIVAL